MVLDVLLEALFDCLRLLPFLYLTYLLMEWLEHGAGERFEHAIARAGRFGPILGALLGVIPQCGFSGVAATLYAARVVTLGTLISVFLATSDEMLPILISTGAPLGTIFTILAIKVVYGMVAGLILDVILSRTDRLHLGFSSRKRHEGHSGHDIHEICESEGCECKEGWPQMLLAALRHTVNVIIFIFVVVFIIDLITAAGLEGVLGAITQIPYLSTLLSALIGLVPNCAVSVAFTEFYLNGLLSGGALIAGLLSNAGIGLLVLLRTNRNQAENLRIIVLLFGLAVLAGFILEFVHVL